MKRLLPLLPLLLLAACATPDGPPPPRPLPAQPSADVFRAADYDWSTAPGDNVILGQIAYRTKALGGFTCAGFSASLIPATPMSAKRVDRLYESTDHAVQPIETVRARTSGEPTPPYADYVRNTKCDEAGRFGFQGLPDGEWFLIVRAKPVKGEGGVAIMQYVEARGGQTQNLKLK